MMISNIGRLTRDKMRARVHYSSSFLGSRGIYRVQGCRVIRTVHTRRSKERKHCGVVANDKSKNAKRRWPTLITMLLKGAHTHSFCRVTAFSYTIAATELAINEVSTERKRELFFPSGQASDARTLLRAAFFLALGGGRTQAITTSLLLASGRDKN